MKVEFEVTRKVLIEVLLERRRLAEKSGPVPRPSGRGGLIAWAESALRMHGMNLWASVDDAPMKAVTEAVEIVDELFPELKEGGS